MIEEKTIFDDKTDEWELDIPKEQRYLNTTSYDYSVDYLVSLLRKENPKIILEVPFQRQFVWNVVKSSQLIESIIMNVPIPPIYFAEEDNDKWLVIDGLQRLTSLLNFYNNEYKLKSLDIISELEGLKYKDLPPKAKSLLDSGMMRVNVIKKDSHPDIKYDIFMRLNKGAVTLNYQELRNCMYRGNLNNLAREITEENEDFLTMIKLKKPHKRFLDVEMVIRYFALRDNLIQKSDNNYEVSGYQGRMVTFLNHYMLKTKLSIEEKEKYRHEFNSMIEKIVLVFGKKDAFKDPTNEKSRANRALADCIMLGLQQYDTSYLEKNKDRILSDLKNLLERDEAFKDSITFRTSDKDILNMRINKFLKLIQY